MRLFDNIARSDMASAYYAEPQYQYLNRTARPAFSRIRQLVEQWFKQYPEFDTPEWLGRFQSADDRNFVGAFFELYVRALLGGHGFSAEPYIGDTGKRAEFLVKFDGEPKFTLECKVAAGPDFGGPEQTRINRVYDTLDRMESPNFFLTVWVEKWTTKDPPASRLRDFVGKKLDGLDPDEIIALASSQGADALPRWVWADDGWEVVLSPIPKIAEARGRPRIRPVGATTGKWRWEADSTKIVISALERKASRYGRPDMPYVVAVDVIDPFVSNANMAHAVFGRLEPPYIGMDAKARHEIKAFWVRTGKPQHKRVSGVLFARHLVPFSAARVNPVLWHNPWADYPLDPDTWLGPQMVLDDVSGDLNLQEGKTAAEILNLSPLWPEERDDDIGEDE